MTQSNHISPFMCSKKTTTTTSEICIDHTVQTYLQYPAVCRHKREVHCVAPWDAEKGRICLFGLVGRGGTATLTPHCFHCSVSLQTPPDKYKNILGESNSLWSSNCLPQTLYKGFHRPKKETAIRDIKKEISCDQAQDGCIIPDHTFVKQLAFIIHSQSETWPKISMQQ